MKKEIRLSGSGGQGLILAGIILAEGAIFSNMNALQSQSYGPEARGGASKSEVIISDEEITFPKIKRPDLLLSLTQKAYDEYKRDLKEDGILIVDSSVNIEDNINVKYVYKIPIIQTAKEKVGRELVANIVALGSIRQITNIIKYENLKKAVLARVPEGSEKLNIKALEEGALLIKQI